MKVRLAIALVALLAVVSRPTATAEILPPVPQLPAPPKELEPLLGLLAPVGGLVSEPGCAALGTMLGLGAVVIPGVPGTLEQGGVPLSGLPIALQPELLSFVNTILFIQGSGCGLLPLAAERTVCATDDDINAQAQQLRAQLNLPGLPVQVGDFVPVPSPTVGAIVDTFRVLATLGIPGATEVVAAFDDVGDCGLRTRLTNVEPPEVPDNPTAGPALPPLPELATGVPSPSLGPPAVLPRAPVLEAAPLVAGTVDDLPGPIPDAVPGWLQGLAVLALVRVPLSRDRTPTRAASPSE